MKKNKLMFSFFILVLFGITSSNAQTIKHIPVYINDKKVCQAYKIVFELNELKAEATKTKNGFEIPQFVTFQKYIDLTIALKEYELFFSTLETDSLKNIVKISVNTKPFNKEVLDFIKDYKNLAKGAIKKGEEIDYIYSLTFYNGTRLRGIHTVPLKSNK